MSIESIGKFNNTLQNINTDRWMQSAEVEPIKGDAGHMFQDLSVQDNKKTMSFSEMLANSLGEVNSLQKDADVAMQKLATGQTKNIHETMLTIEKAEIAFKTMNQIRSKVIDAYKEIMRMQI